jgi:hypothetical protein
LLEKAKTNKNILKWLKIIGETEKLFFFVALRYFLTEGVNTRKVPRNSFHTLYLYHIQTRLFSFSDLNNLKNWKFRFEIRLKELDIHISIYIYVFTCKFWKIQPMKTIPTPFNSKLNFASERYIGQHINKHESTIYPPPSSLANDYEPPCTSGQYAHKFHSELCRLKISIFRIWQITEFKYASFDRWLFHIGKQQLNCRFIQMKLSIILYILLFHKNFFWLKVSIGK